MTKTMGGGQPPPFCTEADISADEMMKIMEESYILGAQEALYRANQSAETIHNISGMIRALNWENDEWVVNLIDHFYELLRGPKDGKPIAAQRPGEIL